MLYVKDYRFLPSPDDNHDQSTAIQQQLNTLIGRMITIYADTGNSRGFTGILTEVSSDSIKLVVPPVNQRGKVQNCKRFGTAVVIAIKHITAITYKSL